MSIVTEMTSGFNFNIEKPVVMLKSIPPALLNKFMLGMKFGLGGMAFIIAVALVVIIVATLLNMIGFNIGGLVNKERTSLGL